VLTTLYKQWSETAVPFDLKKLWEELGVRSSAAGVTLDPKAPLASIRESITAQLP